MVETKITLQILAQGVMGLVWFVFLLFIPSLWTTVPDYIATDIGIKTDMVGVSNPPYKEYTGSLNENGRRH